MKVKLTKHEKKVISAIYSAAIARQKAEEEQHKMEMEMQKYLQYIESYEYYLNQENFVKQEVKRLKMSETDRAKQIITSIMNKYNICELEKTQEVVSKMKDSLEVLVDNLEVDEKQRKIYRDSIRKAATPKNATGMRNISKEALESIDNAFGLNLSAFFVRKRDK